MWILTGSDDQVHPWRQVLEQKDEGIVNRSGVNNVVVIEDQDEIVRDGGGLVEQGSQKRFGRRRLRGPEHTQDTFSYIRGNGLQGSDEVSQEARGVVIPLVQRQPRGWSLDTGDPFANQRGFTRACGGRDEGEFAVQTLVKPLGQAGAGNDSRLREWCIELGG